MVIWGAWWLYFLLRRVVASRAERGAAEAAAGPDLDRFALFSNFPPRETSRWPPGGWLVGVRMSHEFFSPCGARWLIRGKLPVGNNAFFAPWQPRGIISHGYTYKLIALRLMTSYRTRVVQIAGREKRARHLFVDLRQTQREFNEDLTANGECEWSLKAFLRPSVWLITEIVKHNARACVFSGRWFAPVAKPVLILARRVLYDLFAPSLGALLRPVVKRFEN